MSHSRKDRSENDNKYYYKIRSRKESYILKKTGGKCELCKSHWPSDVLCFHHLDPKEKKFSLGNMITILVIVANVIWSASVITNKTKINSDDSELALKMARSNEIKIAVIETKIDQGFKRLEQKIDLINVK